MTLQLLNKEFSHLGDLAERPALQLLVGALRVNGLGRQVLVNLADLVEQALCGGSSGTLELILLVGWEVLGSEGGAKAERSGVLELFELKNCVTELISTRFQH